MMTAIRFIPSTTGEISVLVEGAAMQVVFKAGEAVRYNGAEYTVKRDPFGEFYQLQQSGAKQYVYASLDALLAENPRPMAATDLLAILLGVGVDMDSLIAAYVESKESEAV